MQIDFMLWLQSHSIPALEMIFKAITTIGSDSIYILFVAWLYWCVDQAKGEKWAYLILGSAMVNGIIKLTFKAPRPFEAGYGIYAVDSTTATGHSFPSGHSQASAVFGTYMGLEYKTRIMAIFGICLFLLIGFSRIYLRVHWPVDVLAGWTLGIILALLWHKYYDRYSAPLKVLFLAIMIISSVFFRDADQIKLIGLSIASMIGFEVNRSMGWTNVHPFGKGGKRKLIFGILIIIGLMAGLKIILPVSLNIFRYAMVGIVLSTIYPALFNKLYIKNV